MLNCYLLPKIMHQHVETYYCMLLHLNVQLYQIKFKQYTTKKLEVEPVLVKLLKVEFEFEPNLFYLT